MTLRHSNFTNLTLNSDRKTTLALIDSRPLTRESVSRLLIANAASDHHDKDFSILPVATPYELVDRCSGHYCELDLIIFNTGATRVATIELQQAISSLIETTPDIPLVLLSDLDEPEEILAALRLGVRGYVPTMLDPPVFIQALRLVQAGGSFIPASPFLRRSREQVTSSQKWSDREQVLLRDLTPRQQEVLDLLRQGKANKAIAYDLNLRESTVKVHVRQIMRKLKASNRAHAVFLVSRCTAEDVR